MPATCFRQLPRRSLVALVGVGSLVASGIRYAVAGGVEAGSLAIKRAAPPRPAAPEHFTGRAEVSAPFQADAPARASGAIVRFSPGSRTDWHTHPLGQTLIVLDGTCLVQVWGKAAQLMGPGDVAWIPPGTKHWHGAGPSAPTSHVAVGEVLDGRTVDWLERVSEEQYSQASR